MKEVGSYPLLGLILTAYRPLLQHSMTQESMPSAVWVSAWMKNRRHSLSRLCRLWEVRLMQCWALSTQRILTIQHAEIQQTNDWARVTDKCSLISWSAGLGATRGTLPHTRRKREPQQRTAEPLLPGKEEGPSGTSGLEWGPICACGGDVLPGDTPCRISLYAIERCFLFSR